MTRKPDDYEKTRLTLIARLKNWDDHKSWQDFFNIYWRFIYNAARKAGLTHEEAEDVVQDTIVTVTKKIKDMKYDPALGSFRGWLFTVTRSRVEDVRRKRLPVAPRKSKEERQHPDRTDTVERIADPASLNCDAIWEDEWKSNLAEAAMERVKRKVNPNHWQIFDFYVLRDWSVNKVMETLNVSRAQVYLAKHRIEPLIKAEIKKLEKEPF
jgi:RNA polymerase sigma-70 factor (ECF subfamily)